MRTSQSQESWPGISSFHRKLNGTAMNSNQEKNRVAFQEAKRDLSKWYPPGRFFAFDGGQIVADAASFDELTEALAAIGKNRPDVFVVRPARIIRTKSSSSSNGNSRPLPRRQPGR